MEKNSGNKGLKFALELKDLLAGVAFPLMLMLILSVTFIGMTSSLIDENDKVLSIVMVVIGEVLLGVAMFIFGKQSGVTSVRKLVQNAKKRDIGSNDRAALLGVGEYAPYKGFLIGFLSCVPYMIFQFIQCLSPNSFCTFMLLYVFGWASYPFAYGSLSAWLNFVMVLYPVAVHGAAYIFGAHREWNKVQKINSLDAPQQGGDGE